MIRLAEERDLPALGAVYARARALMCGTGNPTQWAGGYPAEELLQADIRSRQLYVEEGADGALQGAFALIFGPDATYAVIEGGRWLNDAPYAAIHRVASGGQAPGFFGRCVAFCRGRCKNLRIDTHPDNRIMQHLIEKQGFARCGIIHVEDGSPRIAYQWAG